MTTIDQPRAPGIIFDLDGTLADTLEDITDALNELLADLDRPQLRLEEVRGFIGEGLPTLISLVTGIEDEALIASLAERYRPVYSKRLLNKTRLFPGVAEMLEKAAALGCPMSILSNKPHVYTAPICSGLPTSHLFVRCLGHRDGTQRKPDPASALELAAEMNRPAAEILLVGDSSIDVLTGRNAGMTTVGVTWGYRPRGELVDAGAHHVIDRPGQVIEIVRKAAGVLAADA